MTAVHDQHRQKALDQIDALAALADPARPPVRPDTPNADLTLGLGIIGLWAALDEFLERAGVGGRTLPERLSERVPADLVEAAKELEDVRHLFAQDFGAAPDEFFLNSRRRYVLRNRRPRVLDSGANFGGKVVQVEPAHFQWYVALARAIIEDVRL